MTHVSRTPPRLTDSRLATLGAHAIHRAFKTYRTRFREITQRAQRRFERCDWHAMRADAAERLTLYRFVIDQIVATIRELLGERIKQKLVWAGMKAVYSSLIAYHDDWELAETFFNSVTRRIFATVGVDPQIEFVATDYETPPTEAKTAVYKVFPQATTTAALIQYILAAYYPTLQFADLHRDTRLVAAEIEAHLRLLPDNPAITHVEMAKAAFYRSKGSYLVGRLCTSTQGCIPLVLALHNGPAGIEVDSVLLDENSVSILFSFARSYFHVMVDRPYDLVHFLKGIMPRKRVAELYISLGFNKHGKTELYRDMLHHLETSEAQFDISPGQRGMVMSVFNMPDYDLVFKVIKDRFDYPKTTTRQDVVDKYDLVFKHDRAGRLVDAQAFEHLKFERGRFTEALLEELQTEAGDSVQVGDTHVVIHHAYVERRVVPLDLYVREAEPAEAEAAVLDYGRTIKDLAYSNIFPGDMLLKNFGVTRHGRVVFYDYDELSLLTECNFRRMPRAQSYEEELAAEPWFHVDENDVFPEEFQYFLGLPDPLQAAFEHRHADLLHPKFWREVQARIEAGEVIHILPYRRSQRLANRAFLLPQNQKNQGLSNLMEPSVKRDA